MKSLGTSAILRQLVGFASVSRESNLPMVDWVRNYLDAFGVESRFVHNDDRTKANLIARIGPEAPGALALSGHSDVVPVDGQTWATDPFLLTARDDRLHGRGTADMKGFIATALQVITGTDARTFRRPLYLLLSYDEEVGCLGAPRMIAELADALPAPGAVIVGEPTGMEVVDCHKGIRLCRTTVHGSEAHSSLVHEAVSAVMLAGAMVGHLASLAEEASQRGIQLAQCHPPYTSISANMIRGGDAINTLAPRCEFSWDIRAVPGDSAEAHARRQESYVTQLIERHLAEGRRCEAATETLADVPPLRPDRGEAAGLAREILESPGSSRSVPFSTEAGQFQEAGWSAVVCGPGSIEQAHRADEFIRRSELIDCENFLRRAVMKHCLGSGAAPR